jgi:putative sigma-54 modulation protein
MQVIVKGHHIHVSETLKETAVHKLEKLGRFFDRIQKIEIEFSHEKSTRAPAKHLVEVFMTTPLGRVRAHAKATDPGTAVDAVLDKLERQVKKMKDKVAHHDKGGLRARGISPRISPPPAVPVERIVTNGVRPAAVAEEGKSDSFEREGTRPGARSRRGSKRA